MKIILLVIGFLAINACSIIGSHSSNNNCSLGSLSLISGDNQQTLVNQSLQNDFVIQIKDSCGVVAQDVSVQVTDSLSSSYGQFFSDNNGLVKIAIVAPKKAGKINLQFSNEKIKDKLLASFTALAAAPFSLTLLTGSDQSGAVDSLLPQPITFKVSDKFLNPISGMLVYFDSTGSEGSFLSGSLVTDDNGKIDSQYNLGQHVGKLSLKAYLDPSLNISPIVFNENVISGVANNIIKISGDGQSSLAGTALTTPLVAEVIDLFGNPVANTSVTFSDQINGSIFQPMNVVSDFLGQVRSSVILGSTVGAIPLKASLSSGLNVVFIANSIGSNTQPIISNTNSVQLISGNNQTGTLNSILNDPIKIKVINSNNVGVSNIVVSFYSSPAGSFSRSAVTTDANGFAQTNFTLGSIGGNYIITASAQVSGNSILNFNEYANFPAPTPTPTATPMPTIAPIASLRLSTGQNQIGEINSELPLPLEVQIIDSNNQPVANTAVTFSSSPTGTFSAVTSNTDVNGKAKTKLTLGSNSGNYIITASASISGNSTVNFTEYANNPIPTPTPTITPTPTTTPGTPTPTPMPTATPQPLSALRLISGQNQNGLINSILINPLVVRIVDTNNNPVTNVAVSFSSSPAGTFSSNSVTTDSTGTAQSNFTLGSVIGNYSITATAPLFGNNTLNFSEYASAPTPSPTPVPTATPTPAPTATPTPTATPILPVDHLVMVSGSQQSGQVGRQLAPLIVQAVDANGNGVNGVLLNFILSSGVGSFSPTSVATGTDGKGQSIFTMGTVAGLTSSGSVSVAGNSSILSLNFAFSSTPGNFLIIQKILGDTQSAVEGTILPTSLKVKASDQYGNSVSGVAISYNPLSSGGGFLINGSSGTETTTDSSGFATAQLRLGFTVSQQVVSVSGTANGITATVQYQETSTQAPNDPNHLIYVSGNNQTGAINGSLATPMIVKVVDASGNPVAGFPVGFTIVTANGGSFSSSTSITTTSVSTLADGTASAPPFTFLNISGKTTITSQAQLPGIPNQISFSQNAIAAGPNDGLLSTGFNLGAGFNVTPSVMIWDQSSNGTKIIFGGNFTTYKGVAVGRIARIDISGNLDAGFNSGAVGFDGSVLSIVQDPNTFNLYVGGAFINYNTASAQRIIRLNSSGLRDSAFNIGTGVTGGFDSSVSTMILDPLNNFLYVAGSFSTYKTIPVQKIVRLKTNSGINSGTIDNSFINNILTTINFGQVNSMILDSKYRLVLVGENSSKILRLNANGSFDNSFNFGSGFDAAVNSVAIDSYGKILVGGAFTAYNGSTTQYGRIIRLNDNGSVDVNFNGATGAVGFNGTVNSIVVLPLSGKVIVGGNFSSYNSISTGRIAALNNDGSMDSTFQTGLGFDNSVNLITPLVNQQLAILGTFTKYGSSSNAGVSIIQESDPGASQHQIIVNIIGGGNGTITSSDQSINCGGGNNSCIATIINNGSITLTATPDSNSGFIQWTDLCTNTTGNTCTISNITKSGSVATHFNNTGFALAQQINPYFNPAFSLDSNANAISQVLIDGSSSVLVGSFTSYNGYPSPGIVKLSANGSVDTSFNVGTGIPYGANSIVKDVNGNYLVAGTFSTYNGVTTGSLIRILPNGALDTNFNLGGVGASGNIYSLLIAPNGKIYFAGTVNSYNGIPVSGIVSLNSDGSLNTTFTGNQLQYISGVNIGPVLKILMDPQGRIILFSNSNTRKILRYLSNGQLDTSFDSGAGPAGLISSIAYDSYGKLLVGGSFTTYTGPDGTVYNVKNMVRLNSNGGVDVLYTKGLIGGFNASVIDIKVQSNGQVLVGGNFTSFNNGSVAYLIRLNADGTIDPNFNNNGFNGPIYSISELSSGYLVGGGFSSYNFNGTTTTANKIAIIFPDENLKSSVANIVVSLPSTSANKILDSQNKINCGMNSGICSAVYSSAATVTFTLTYGVGYSNAYWEDSCYGQTGDTCTLSIIPGNNYSVSTRFTYNGTDQLGQISPNFGTLFGFNTAPLALEKDGAKIVVGGAFTSYNGSSVNKLVRLNANGNLDSTFNPPYIDGPVTGLLLSLDKKSYYVIGSFTNVGGITVSGIVSINEADGSLNSTFNTSSSFASSFTPTDIKFDNDSKLMIVGKAIGYNSVNRAWIYKLDPVTGTADPGFKIIGAVTDSDKALFVHNGYQNESQKIAIDSLNRYVVSSSSAAQIIRFLNNGQVDPSFKTGSGFSSNATLGTIDFVPVVFGAATDSFNRVIVVGSFTSYNGSGVKYIARLNSDGSLDSTFKSPLGYGFDKPINGIRLIDNNKIAVWGNFNNYDVTSTPGFAVLNPDNSINNNYFGTNGSINGQINGISEVNGQALIYGSITSYNNLVNNQILSINPIIIPAINNYYISVSSLNPDGNISVTDGNALNCGSNCLVSYSSGSIVNLTATVGADTQFLGWGDSCASNGTNLTCKLTMTKNLAVSLSTKYIGTNKEGLLDYNFTSDLGFSETPNIIVKLATGGSLIGLSSSGYYNDSAVSALVKVDKNGNLDNTFNSNIGKINGAVNSLIVINNKIYISGNFTNLGSYSTAFVAKLNMDGTPDSNFHTTFVNGGVSALAYDGTSLIVVGGMGQADGSSDVADKININTGLVDVVLMKYQYYFAEEVTAVVTDGGNNTYIAFTGSNLLKIVKFLPNGNQDPTFKFVTSKLGTVTGMSVDSFNRVIYFGQFRQPEPGISRLRSDGSNDPIFSSNITSGTENSGGFVKGVTLLANSKLLVYGSFSSFNGYASGHIARLNSDGSIDQTAAFGTGFDNDVNSVQETSDGLLIAGNFSLYQSRTQNKLSNLYNGPTVVASKYSLLIDLLGTGTGAVNSNPNGISCSTASGGSSCTNAFANGTPITLTANIALGSSFTGWTDSCASFGTSLTCTISPNSNTAVTALFSSP